jgi:molybdenum cofactor cytidylyltransferase
MLKLSTVILAAGASRRLGFNKLCVRIEGEAVVRRTVRTFLEADAGDVVVVTGFERERVEAALAGLNVRFAHNAHYPEGMSTSVRAALPMVAGSGVVLFHLGDKCLIERAAIRDAIAAFEGHDGSIVVGAHDGTRGHPVIVDMEKYGAEVGMVRGEGGLRDVVARHKADVRLVECGEGAVLDLDTEDDIARLRRRGYTIEKG